MRVVTFNLLIPAEQSLAWLMQITSLKLMKSFPCSKRTQNTIERHPKEQPWALPPEQCLELHVVLNINDVYKLGPQELVMRGCPCCAGVTGV